jgi:CSLREA domain-containing protein
VNIEADTLADDGHCSLREAVTSANLDSASGALAGGLGGNGTSGPGGDPGGPGGSRKIGKKKLKPGRHRAVLVANDLAGNRSRAKRLGFTVVP